MSDEEIHDILEAIEKEREKDKAELETEIVGNTLIVTREFLSKVSDHFNKRVAELSLNDLSKLLPHEVGKKKKMESKELQDFAHLSIKTFTSDESIFEDIFTHLRKDMEKTVLEQKEILVAQEKAKAAEIHETVSNKQLLGFLEQKLESLLFSFKSSHDEAAKMDKCNFCLFSFPLPSFSYSFHCFLFFFFLKRKKLFFLF